MLSVQRTELLTDLVFLLQKPDATTLERYLCARKDELAQGLLDYVFLELCERLQNDEKYESPIKMVLR